MMSSPIRAQGPDLGPEPGGGEHGDAVAGAGDPGRGDGALTVALFEAVCLPGAYQARCFTPRSSHLGEGSCVPAPGGSWYPNFQGFT